MKEYQEMVVIFVDLLGTQNNSKFEDKLFIHNVFHSEARVNESRNLEHVIYDRKVYSFSDCAYFFYYFKDEIEESRKDKMKLIQVNRIHGDGSRDSFWIIFQMFYNSLNPLYKKASCTKDFSFFTCAFKTKSFVELDKVFENEHLAN